jgi:Flp pilus assembly protein TadD
MRAVVFQLLCAVATLGPGAYAGNIALLRDATVVTAVTPAGPSPVKLTPATASPEVYLVVLTDTLNSDDLARVRREISVAFRPPFPVAHPLHLVYVSGTGGEVSGRVAGSAELQAALNRLSPTVAAQSSVDLLSALGGLASGLPANWSNAIIVGRLPAVSPDQTWVAAWLGEIFRAQRIRLSFWSVDGTAPAWAQGLAAASQGLVSTSSAAALLTMLDDDSELFEAAWDASLIEGAWTYQAELKNAAGQTMASFPALARAPNFLPALPLYLPARAAMFAAAAGDAQSARKVLEFNPADGDALRRLAILLSKEGKPKDSAALWQKLSQVTPLDGEVWAQWGATLYSAGLFQDAARALDRAAQLGAKTTGTFEVRAGLYVRRGDFAKALTVIDEALSDKTTASQSLWLLRADCARNLKRWPLESESLERAAAIAALPIDQSTRLISGYLAANDTAHALPQLHAVTNSLPRDARIRAQYAQLWENAREPSPAEALWKSALECDNKFEPAYVGLARHYLDAHRAVDALHFADAGLLAVPSSLQLVLAKEDVLERMGDIYGARRLLSERASDCRDPKLIERRAFLEDAYGSAAAEAYAARLQLLVENEAPQVEVVELCRRGLLVSLRDERLDAAKIFAEKLASAGDRSGQDLLQVRRSAAASSFELPGGVDAFNFLIFGRGKNTPERILIDYSRALSAMGLGPHEGTVSKSWLTLSERIHEYFRIVSALTVLGERKNGEFRIELTLTNKAGRQRTEKVFSILGLKLKSNKDGLALRSGEGKSQAKKQDALAALAIDEDGIQETLAAGKAYQLAIPMDSIPVFPSTEFWQTVSGEHERYAGGLAEALVNDGRLARLFYALNSMDRATAQLLARWISIRNLEERYSSALSFYSAALALNGSAAEVPGGTSAAAAWRTLTGVGPENAVPFFQALLDKDGGRLMGYFYSLSQLDFEHQRFFTRSPQRLKRFYDLFRESAEMRHGGEHRIGSGSFVEFLREVPLNEDLTVDFPGSPEVWMVAKGRNISTSSVAKLNRRMKRSVAPDDEDEILVRLATSAYKSQEGEQSELANFIATVHIDAQRSEPLTPEAALLLAQGYSAYGGLYRYFAELGDMETGDYQKLFTLNDRFNSFDLPTANLRLGEVHSFLAMLGLLHERGSVAEKDLLAVYRKTLDHYLAANSQAAWTIASLSALADLASLAAPHVQSRDEAIETLLVGNSACARRKKAFAQVLTLQKAPSLDALFTIWSDLAKISSNPALVEDLQRQISSLVVLPTPKTWRLEVARKKYLESFETAQALSVLAKIREKEGKRKINPADIEKLTGDLIADLEPWVQLAMVSRIYARYLDPTDLLVSEDPLLVRKHEFTELGMRMEHLAWFRPSALNVTSAGEGSFFIGGLADFGVSAGEARSAGNHIGGRGQAFATAVFASIRSTDWSALTPRELQAFGATIRLAREWIVESTMSDAVRRALEHETLGLLSLHRRHSLLDALDEHDWAQVWQSVTVSDLYFLGQTLLEDTASGKMDSLWKSPSLAAMRQTALEQKDLDALGSVAPALNGCSQPRLRRYAPYEDYERYYRPDRMAQRTAELKLYLAWMADNRAWEPRLLDEISVPAAEKLLASFQARDEYDWSALIDACRKLAPETLQALVTEK